jgi:SAM-dependent methyltransferase
MKEANAKFAGSIPEVYHENLGPLLFEPFARDLAARVTLPPSGSDGSAILELAAGTGILSRRLRETLPPDASLTVTDLNEPMLDVARKLVGDAPGVTWQQADASALPFPDRSFDAVISQFGIMFFPDKEGAAREVRRVLRPGGRFWFNVWRSLEDNPIARITHRTIASFFASDPPDFYLVPFGYHEESRIRADLTRAGLENIAFAPVDIEGVSPSAEHAANGLVRGNPVLIAIQERGVADPQAIVAAVAQALVKEFGDRPLRIPLRALVVSSNRPAA